MLSRWLISPKCSAFPGLLARGLLLAWAVVLYGCDLESSTSKPQANNGTIEVRLGYFANLTHAQGLLGVRSGEFERAISPHRLVTRLFNAGPSMIEALF